jgi:hypothetical protein
MGDQVYRLKDGEEMPVEPTGVLATQGWLPGTWVKYTSVPVSLPGGLATVDLSGGTGVLAGFLVTGPQHNTPVEKLSDMWTTNTRQREGGDTAADWSSIDAGAAFQFDSDSQLQRMGSRVVTMAIPPTGYFKFYVFETEDLAERTTPGTGAPEQESLLHPWSGYVVGTAGTDYEGDFIYAVADIAFG